MTEAFYQPSRTGLHLINELKGVSKDSITLAAGNSYVSGEVLGINADNSQHIKLNLDSDAAEGADAVAVLFGDVDATKAAQPGIAHTRVCAVRADKLIWPKKITTGRKAELIAQLVAKNIVPR